MGGLFQKRVHIIMLQLIVLTEASFPSHKYKDAIKTPLCSSKFTNIKLADVTVGEKKEKKKRNN